ncbi:ATP-binding cassette domain-containing protein [Candidatus Microgenomates bacterium]|nr:ATP-binding cassette domain-containing protein [Candidatus Microgenomates bacterium]
MVKFAGATKKFGKILALDNVSFEVAGGEFVFITGPSGSGKTTVLRLILRDLQPDQGEILFDNKKLSDLKSDLIPLYRRHLGVVFQDFKLLPDRTVGENVMLALAVLGLPLAKQEHTATEVLSYVGLGDRANFFPAQLAGGELQRAVIARAIATRPKLLLADEPTGNLDPETAWNIMQIFEKINQDGTTIMMATHNHDIVDKMKKRVISLKSGKIVRDQPAGKYKED